MLERKQLNSVADTFGHRIKKMIFGMMEGWDMLAPQWPRIDRCEQISRKKKDKKDKKSKKKKARTEIPLFGIYHGTVWNPMPLNILRSKKGMGTLKDSNMIESKTLFLVANLCIAGVEMLNLEGRQER